MLNCWRWFVIQIQAGTIRGTITLRLRDQTSQSSLTGQSPRELELWLFRFPNRGRRAMAFSIDIVPANQQPFLIEIIGTLDCSGSEDVVV